MQKAGTQAKLDVEMIAQIMTQIPKEYNVATQVARIMPAANWMLKTVQQVYIDLWNAKYKNKIQANKDNVALYANASRNKSKWNWKKFKGHCRYCSIQDHKEHKSCKKNATEKAENSDRPVESKTERYATETRICFKCKPKGHIAKNCPKKKGNNNAVDAFFVGMILSGEDKDLDILQAGDIKNEIILCTKTNHEEHCMTSQMNCLSLDQELIWKQKLSV